MVNLLSKNVPDKAVLKITYIGYQDLKVSVDGKTEFNLIMREDDQTLDELVVVGYGVVKKSDLTGAIGSVQSEKITAAGSTNLAGGLQGSIAEVNITQSSSRAGDSFTMQIRGKSSLQGGEPLYVVDGVVCENIDFLNPMDIKEEGVLYDSYERWNIKTAVEHKINEHFTAGGSVNLSTALKHSGSKNSVINGFLMSPIMNAYYWKGENSGMPITQPGKDVAIYPNGGGPTSNINPIVDRENSVDDTRTYDAMANIFIQYSPIKEVILKTTLSPMYTKRHNGVFYAANVTQARSGKTNYAESENNELFSYTWDTQANYVKTFGKHSINALGLFSVYQQKREGDGLVVTDMPFNVRWHNMGSAANVENKTSYYEKISMLSYVLRLNYDYMSKYLITVSSRWDGSSKFQKGNRWGMFPSAALGWRLSEEPFMQGARSWLDNLKFRLSFGLTGNNVAVGPYDTQLVADTKYYYNFGNTVANGYGYALNNADLTWEKTTEFNVGLDYGFLGNRINGAIDYYIRTSRDLLMEMQTPLEMGSSTGAIWGNVGKVRNSGIEVTLNTVNIQKKDLTWTTNFTFAHNHNEIIELNGGKQDMTGNWWFIGQPIDVVYGYKQIGIVSAERARAFAADASKNTKFYEGEMEVADKDGDGVIHPSDRYVLGHAAPTWTGSLNSSFIWKNFDFSFSIYTSQGSKVYSPFMAEFTDYGQRGIGRLSMDFYIPSGVQVLDNKGDLVTTTAVTNGSYPFPTNGSNHKGGGQFWLSGKNGSQYFVDNSYTKVKNIIWGYTLPKKLITKVGMSSLRLYINIINPFVFTNYKGFDPEWAEAPINNGTGGPSTRSYQIGANLKF